MGPQTPVRIYEGGILTIRGLRASYEKKYFHGQKNGQNVILRDKPAILTLF
jgi:hypothetical protein